MLTIMRVADVLNLPSIESDWETGETAGEVIQFTHLDSGHATIREQMRKDGINAIPIHVASVYRISCDYNDPAFATLPSDLGMGNGHHRLKMAVELGHKYILTSDDMYDTGEDDDPVISLSEVDLGDIGEIGYHR
jgi:hypothetical protein